MSQVLKNNRIIISTTLNCANFLGGIVVKKEERTRYVPVFEGKNIVVLMHRQKFILKISDAYIGTFAPNEFADFIESLKDEMDTLKSEIRTLGVAIG